MSIFGKLFSKKNDHSAKNGSLRIPNPLLTFHVSEARNLLIQGDCKEALFHCREAMILDNTNADIYRLRGAIRFSVNDSVGAVDDFQQAIELSNS